MPVISNLTTAQIAALNTTVIASLTTAELATLSTAQVQAFTTAQIGVFSATQRWTPPIMSPNGNGTASAFRPSARGACAACIPGPERTSRAPFPT